MGLWGQVDDHRLHAILLQFFLKGLEVYAVIISYGPEDSPLVVCPLFLIAAKSGPYKYRCKYQDLPPFGTTAFRVKIASGPP